MAKNHAVETPAVPHTETTPVVRILTAAERAEARKKLQEAKKEYMRKFKENVKVIKDSAPPKGEDVAKRFRLEIALHEKNILPANLGLITIGPKDSVKRDAKIKALRSKGLL